MFLTAFEGELATVATTPAGHPAGGSEDGNEDGTAVEVTVQIRRTKVQSRRVVPAPPLTRIVRATGRLADRLRTLPIGATIIVIGTVSSAPGVPDLVIAESIGQGLLLDRDDDTEHLTLGTEINVDLDDEIAGPSH